MWGWREARSRLWFSAANFRLAGAAPAGDGEEKVAALGQFSCPGEPQGCREHCCLLYPFALCGKIGGGKSGLAAILHLLARCIQLAAMQEMEKKSKELPAVSYGAFSLLLLLVASLLTHTMGCISWKLWGSILSAWIVPLNETSDLTRSRGKRYR